MYLRTGPGRPVPRARFQWAAALRGEVADRFAPHLAQDAPGWPDPYADSDPAPSGLEWRAAPARPGDYDDLYAHRPVSST